MFTGLIQTLGKIQPLGSDRFAIIANGSEGAIALQDLAIGDSVAVDGVCLTVEEFVRGGFIATASPETLDRTRLGQIDPKVDSVNLETSLRVGSKLGGHFVMGHVDGVGCLLEVTRTQTAWEMAFGPIPELLTQWERSVSRYLIPKGSVAVNGISLTVADCDAEGRWFKVAVIPHTYAQTNLCSLQPGSWVNLESDILGKYVDKLLGCRSPVESPIEEISLAFLADNGYL